MPLSEKAIENDKKSGIPLKPVKKIYADSEFNCRGNFTAQDIIELVRDVATRGLLEPIIIRPLWPVVEAHLINKGYEYSLVAGFRRYSSYKANNAEFIPAIVREITSEFDCRDINAVENLQRKDLTFWQEAKSIRHYWMASWTRAEIAERVNKSMGWVQLRIMLLEMEPEIQTAANQGYIVATDMHDLARFKGDERLRVAGRLRDARKTGQTRGIKHRLHKREKASSKKIRRYQEIQDVMDLIRTAFKEADLDQMVLLGDIITPQGNSIIHRIMAWSTGQITSLDVHIEIRDFCKKIGVNYEIPEFVEE